MPGVLRHSELKRSLRKKVGRNTGTHSWHLSFVLLCCSFIAWSGNITAASDNVSLTTEDIAYDSDLFGRTERSFGGSVVEPPQRPNSYWDDPHFRPYFDNSTDRNVTFQLSKPSYLHCRIRQLGDRVVSWVRQRDLHILTVGKYTYTTDQRYTSIHMDDTDDWTLEIKYTQKLDAGIYECQVSTEPKMSLPIQLNVVIAEAKVLEGPALYIQSGSTINLTCIVKEYAVPPIYVFWYHDDQMIDYETQKGRGIKVTTEKGPTTYSRFRIEKAQATDSGNYSCQASYADPANITVHVLNGSTWNADDGTQGDENNHNVKGEKPAAMQHGPNGSHFHAEIPVLLIGFSVLTSFYLI
ncbi:uncharacterized protein [Parasteatoda tepidariorum]|uniref:uncharacterized protein isoform X1 n=1 Tax=Parasteatoda tepidariorum TaxID=114398 RepID=UPI0039BC3971